MLKGLSLGNGDVWSPYLFLKTNCGTARVSRHASYRVSCDLRNVVKVQLLAVLSIGKACRFGSHWRLILFCCAVMCSIFHVHVKSAFLWPPRTAKPYFIQAFDSNILSNEQQVTYIIRGLIMY